MIFTLSIPNGWYAVALPNGNYAVTLKDAQAVKMKNGTVAVPTPNRNLLWLDMSDEGFFGQGHQDDRVWSNVNGVWKNVAPAIGPRACIVAPSGLTKIATKGDGSGALGYIQFDDSGRAITTESHYADKARRIYEYTTLNGVTIGQGGDGPDGDDPLIAILPSGSVRLLSRGRCRAVRFKRDGASLAIAWSQEDQQCAKLLWLTYDDLLALPVYTRPTSTPTPAPSPAPAPSPEPTPTMKFPQRVQDIIQTLYTQNVALANGTDDQRRALTKMIVEQVVFEFPNDGYGWKSADPGRPPSKDAMAKKAGAQLIAWDLFNGTTRAPNQFPESMDITGQNFIAVAGVNHLAAPTPQPAPSPAPAPTPEPPPQPAPSPVDPTLLLAVTNVLAVVQQLLVVQVSTLEELKQQRTDLDSAAADIKKLATDGVKVRF